MCRNRHTHASEDGECDDNLERNFGCCIKECVLLDEIHTLECCSQKSERASFVFTTQRRSFFFPLSISSTLKRLGLGLCTVQMSIDYNQIV